MALTSAQQAEMNKLKEEVQSMREVVMNSPVMTSAGNGNYLFDKFEKIEGLIESVEEA